MTNSEHCVDGTERFGPATVMCPFCNEIVEIDAGPTRRVEVDHCGEGWFVADLVTEKTGYTESLQTGGDWRVGGLGS